MHSLVIHYHRKDREYDDWDLWLWHSTPPSASGLCYSITRFDEFGAVFELDVPSAVKQVGFLLREGGILWRQKEGGQDRFLQMRENGIEVWVVQDEETPFLSYADARAAVFPYGVKAYLDGPGAVTLCLESALLFDGNPGTFSVHDVHEEHKWQVMVTSSSTADELTTIQLALPEAIDVTHPCFVTGSIAADLPIIPRRVLDDQTQFYPQEALGSFCTPTSTVFRLWAPTATKVELHLFRDDVTEQSKVVSLTSDAHGAWHATLFGDWNGYYYLYRVMIHQITSLAVDPYAKALSPDRTRGLVVDLSRTNPPDWANDPQIHVQHPTDAIIYEMHLRDFSAHPSSEVLHPGKYLQFTESETNHHEEGWLTGLAHLRELGITHVQLLPIQEFGRYGEKSYDEYNWGYDPRFYMVPEGRYATSRTGTHRITECKQMIQAFHHHGIGVILDVVLNHAFHPTASVFHQIVPDYYFRTDDEGRFTDGAGVGNELASERPMVKRYLLDVLTYWLTEFHVDGFRFDLMALIGKSAMLDIAKRLRAIRPDVLLYGEPWSANPSGIYGDDLFLKGDQKNTGIAVFNDHLRDALIGSVFDHHACGYATGRLETMDDIKKGVVGSIPFQGRFSDFADSPCEVVNYVSCHDNLTLWDRIHVSDPWETEHTKIAMDLLAQAIILTSQGIPFLHSGEEFLRTKHGQENTYLAGDLINALEWPRKLEYHHVFSYYRGLIELRKSHPAFRMSDRAQVNDHLEFLQPYPPLIAWALHDHANQDPWKTILVLINPMRTFVHFALPEGVWVKVVDHHQAGVYPIGEAQGQTEVAPISCQILYQS